MLKDPKDHGAPTLIPRTRTRVAFRLPGRRGGRPAAVAQVHRKGAPMLPATPRSPGTRSPGLEGLLGGGLAEP